MKNSVSPEVEVAATKIAKGTQKMGQTKEQTKLIAQGIQKGIAEYKKQQGKKLRDIDKQRKQKVKQQPEQHKESQEVHSPHLAIKYLPWLLLIVSWTGFLLYIALYNKG